MEYQKFNCNSFNIHTIKTNKFKSIHLEVIFRNKLTKESLPMYTLLCDILTDSCALYKTRKEMAIKTEELYKTILYGINSKVGSEMFLTFVCEFIDPKYIKDEKYLENVIEFTFNCINSPNVENGEFNISQFNVVKKRLLMDLESISESPDKKAINNALNIMDPNSDTTFKTLGTKEIVENITPEKLYQAYKDLFNHFNCDVYIVGNVTDEYVRLVKKYFKNRVIKDKKIPLLVDNKVRKKTLVKSEVDKFGQSNLILIYNVDREDTHRNNIAFHAFNNILCAGGLTSILYQKLREENSLCYSIRSMYLRYDQLLLIQVSLDNKNIKKAEELIKESIKELAKGKLVDETILANTKQNLKFLVNTSRDNNVSILNTYLFNDIDSSPLYDERIEIIDTINLNDIAQCAKSLKLNLVYSLIQEGGETNEGK